MVSIPDGTFDDRCRTNFPSLATGDEIEPDNFCSMTDTDVIQNILKDTKKKWEIEEQDGGIVYACPWPSD